MSKCPCGRAFAKPFGMRVHQRTCTAVRELEALYGHCDTCGAPCDAQGCTVDREHQPALDVNDPAPRI